jgi:hypothetical protein
VARREILERTKGQAFRLDPAEGPLFVLSAAYRFALGTEHDPDVEDVRRPPTWSGLQAVAA